MSASERSGSERQGLAKRIGQMRRPATATDASSAALPLTDLAELHALKARVTQLEEMLQGLQDSVYRESQRRDRRIAKLEAQLDPAAIAAALSKDARERGL